MGATSVYYRTQPKLLIYGGMDFDYALTVRDVTSVAIDGRLALSPTLGDAIDFTGWTAFAGQLRSFDGLYSETCSIGVDGPPDEGVLYIRGVAAQTWRLQQAGVTGGKLTIIGAAPSGQRLLVADCVFELLPGSTSPNTPSIPDWTVLR